MGYRSMCDDLEIGCTSIPRRLHPFLPQRRRVRACQDADTEKK
jgi:hypothetical protein